MKKFIAVIAGFVFSHSPAFYERKRKKLSKRLHNMFIRDLKEGLDDYETRCLLAIKLGGIDMYDAMTEAEQCEYEMWKDRLYEIRHLRNEIDSDRSALIKESGGELLHPAYDRVDAMFDELEATIKGRMNALDEDYCLTEYRAKEYYGYLYRPEAEEARMLGINFVAIERYLARSEMEAAMYYIFDNKLASLNYEKTCEAIKKYQAAKVARYRAESLTA